MNFQPLSVSIAELDSLMGGWTDGEMSEARILVATMLDRLAGKDTDIAVECVRRLRRVADHLDGVARQREPYRLPSTWMRIRRQHRKTPFRDWAWKPRHA